MRSVTSGYSCAADCVAVSATATKLTASAIDLNMRSSLIEHQKRQPFRKPAALRQCFLPNNRLVYKFVKLVKSALRKSARSGQVVLP